MKSVDHAALPHDLPTTPASFMLCPPYTHKKATLTQRLVLFG